MLIASSMPHNTSSELQDIQHAFLCLAGPIVLQGDPQAVLDVAPGLAGDCGKYS